MKKNSMLLRTLTVASLVVALGAFTGCSSGKTANLTDKELSANEIADFTKGQADTFFASDGWSNGSVFNCQWKADHVTYSDEAMHLTISENDKGSEKTNNEYFGGEARSYQHFGFGDYEVKMRPSNKEGTASTFFTCTGSYDTDEQGNPNPWDEIDIEFLGKDTTKVQFNYFVNGTGGHEYMYNLGFDASKEYHEYGYRWTAEYIVWFVDDKPVYKVEATNNNPLPNTPGRILMNYWCGTKDAKGWMGSYGGDGRNSADYMWVHTSAAPTGDLPTPEEDVEVPQGEAQAFTFFGDECYEIVQPEDKKSLTVNYSDMQGETYSNVLASTPEGVGKNKFVFTVKNNGAKDATVRVNMQGEKKSGNTDCCNLSAAATDEINVETDLNWGGSKFVLAAGQETTVVVTYTSNGAQGKLQNVMFMIDSCINADTEKHTGSVTFTNMYFAGEEEVSTDPVEPEQPEGNQSVVINGQDVSFVTDPGYTLSYDNEANNVTASYTNITGNSYLNFNANVRAIALGKTTFTTKIKNNGENEALIRIDMEGENTVSNETNTGGHKDCATGCSATNGVTAATDLIWAGSSLRLPAGQETEFTITYTSNAAYGKITTLKLFVDDSQYDDTTTHIGSVTFSEMAFSGEEEIEAGEGGEEATTTKTNLTFNSNDSYTVDKNGEAADEVTVTYADVSTNTYVNFGASVPAEAQGMSKFSFSCTNNGDHEACLRIDMSQSGTNKSSDISSENGKACWFSAGDSAYLKLGAGESDTFTVTYTDNPDYICIFAESTYSETTETHSGSITLKNFEFKA